MEQTLIKELGFVKIDCLPHKKLLSQLDVIIEPDSKGFIARTPDMPLYGYGEDPIEGSRALLHYYSNLEERNSGGSKDHHIGIRTRACIRLINTEVITQNLMDLQHVLISLESS